MDGSGNGYLKTVCDYVHLNPVRAKLLPADEPLRTFAGSSWPEYLKTPAKRWPWLRVDRLLGEYRIPKDSTAGRQHLEERLEARRAEEVGMDYKSLRRGWCLGPETFREELLGQMQERLGAEHYGEERRETAEALAERMVKAELKRWKWNEHDLEQRPKGNRRKVDLAVRLRLETVMTVKWIAARLQMGTPGYVNHLLQQRQKKGGKK